jgi:hypothetical protein
MKISWKTGDIQQTNINFYRNQDSVVRIMTRVWAGYLGVVVQFLAEPRDFSLLKSLEMGSGVHPIQRVLVAFSMQVNQLAMKLTTYFHLVPRCRVSGAGPPVFCVLYCY